MNITPKKITKAIRGLLAKEWRGQNPYAINCGNCEEFAGDIEKKLDVPGAEWIDCHCVFLHVGRYYDAENPEGVDSIEKLNVVKNAGREAYHKIMRKRLGLS